MKKQLGDKRAKHLYMVYFGKSTADTIEVHANNAEQAAAIARKNGYSIYAVNMIG